MKQSNIDMTQGVVWKQLALFAVPILLGELFQQLYNTVDSAIVGSFVGADALAAVGATGNITKMIVGFFTGISLGCTVVIARLFGAKELNQIRDAVHTVIFLSVVLAVILSLLGVTIAPWMLRVINTPDNVFHLAETYLRIYFGGLSGLILYNTANGILRAVGDSKHPLYFLIFSSAVNVVLDIVFVVSFHAGVDGVAYATIISQIAAAVFCIGLLLRTKEVCRWDPHNAKIRPELISEILQIGVPTGLQKLVTSFSNVFVLSYIAFFGSTCLAGWAVYTKINNFMTISAQSISSSITTFVSQNLGAGNHKRVRKGVSTGLCFSLFVTFCFALSFFVSAPVVVRFFGTDPEMTEYALHFIRSLAFLQLFQTFMSTMAGALRGVGRAKSSTALMLMGLVVIRQIYLIIIKQVANSTFFVGLAYPVGWFAGGVLLYICYRHYLWKQDHA